MYLFDTDTLSHVMRRAPSPILMAKYDQTPDEHQFTSAINVGELLYGAYRIFGNDTILRQVESLILPNFVILPFDAAAAETYARVRVNLERQGLPLAEPDLRIASIALVHDLTLVTGNVRHFARVPRLRVENWIVSSS